MTTNSLTASKYYLSKNSVEEFMDGNPGVSVEDYADSGNTSEFTQKMVDYFTIEPELYYKKYGLQYPEAVEENGPEARWSKYLPETINELKRIVKQTRDKKVGTPGYCKLGTVELSIPPIQISVNDIKNNHTYKTLRTNSDMTFSSGHTNKIVEMDIYFNGIDEINNNLRPLLAQLKSSPYVPIDNDYIRSIVNPDFKNIEYEDEDGNKKNLSKEIEDINAGIAQEQTKYQDEISSMQASVKNDKNAQYEFDHLKNDVANYYAGVASASKYEYFVPGVTFKENIDISIAQMPSLTPELVDRLLSSSEEASVNTEILTSKSALIFGKHYNNKTAGNLVLVLSQMTVSVVPGFPESLYCHLTCFLFNYFPFSQKFEYITWDNEPTIDIDNCEYFIKWYSDRFLNKKNKNKSKDAVNRFYLDTLGQEMEGSVKLEYIFEPELDYDTKDTKDGETKNNKDKKAENIKQQSMYFSIETNQNNVCSAVTVSNKNDIVMLPVLAHSVPTCQYLGRTSSEILLTFDVLDDIFLEKLKFFSETVDVGSRISVKRRRKNFVTVDNELLRLNGIQRAVIQSVDTTTVPGQPGLTRVNIKLAEFDIDQLSQELITIAPGMTNDRLIALFDYEYSKIPEDQIQTEDFPVSDAIKETLMADEASRSKAGMTSNLLNVKRTLAIRGMVRDGQGLVGGKKEPFEVKNVPANVIDIVTEKAINPQSFWGKGVLEAAKGLVTASAQPIAAAAQPLASLNTKKKYQEVRIRKTGLSSDGKNEPWNFESRKKFAEGIQKGVKEKGIGAMTDDMKTSIMAMPKMQDKYTQWERDLRTYLQGQEARDGGGLSEGQRKVLVEKNLNKMQDKNHILYPDMDLPQYGDLPNLNRPTYSKMGVKPPFGVDGYKYTNRTDEDIVEPDFYLYNMELKKITGQGQTFEGIKSKTFRQGLSDSIDDIKGIWKSMFKKSYVQEVNKNEKAMATDLLETIIRNSQGKVDDLEALENAVRDNQKADNANDLRKRETALTKDLARTLRTH